MRCRASRESATYWLPGADLQGHCEGQDAFHAPVAVIGTQVRGVEPISESPKVTAPNLERTSTLGGASTVGAHSSGRRLAQCRYRTATKSTPIDRVGWSRCRFGSRGGIRVANLPTKPGFVDIWHLEPVGPPSPCRSVRPEGRTLQPPGIVVNRRVESLRQRFLRRPKRRCPTIVHHGVKVAFRDGKNGCLLRRPPRRNGFDVNSDRLRVQCDQSQWKGVRAACMSLGRRC